MSNQLPPLTPSAYLEIMAARINSLQEGGITTARLFGIPLKSDIQSKSYSGFRYASIKDPINLEQIDARIPDKLFDSIEWNTEAIFIGTLRFKNSKGSFKAEFRLDGIERQGENRLLTKNEIAERWSEVIHRPKRDIIKALSIPKPRISLITGVGSVALDDIQHQLKEFEQEIGLEVHRVSMTNPPEIVRKINECTDVNLIVLTRGGGPDVDILDDDALIEAMYSSVVPTVAALGHSTDNLIVARVADGKFTTPTDFGAWLRKTLHDKKVHEHHQKLAQDSQQMLQQFNELRAEILKQNQRKTIWQFISIALGVVAVLAIIITVWALIR
jgi:exodeoxyribonuclease VII large subunit